MNNLRNTCLAFLLCVTPGTLLSDQGETVGPATTAPHVQLVIEGADGKLIPVVPDATLKSVGWVPVPVAEYIDVYASDINRDPVEVLKVSDGLYAVLGTGKVWIEVECEDDDKGIKEKHRYTLEIPESAKPDDRRREWNSASAREAAGVLDTLGAYYADVFRETANRVADGRISSDRELADYMIPANSDARSGSRAGFDKAFEDAMPNGTIDDREAVAELLREVAEAFDNG